MTLFARAITAESLAVGAAESGTPAAAAGVDVANKRSVTIQVHTLVGSPTYTVTCWIKIGDTWTLVNNGEYAGKTTTFSEQFSVDDHDRFFAQITALSTGSVKRTYATTR